MVHDAVVEGYGQPDEADHKGSKGSKASVKKGVDAAAAAEEEEKQLAIMMMSKKKRKLYAFTLIVTLTSRGAG